MSFIKKIVGFLFEEEEEIEEEGQLEEVSIKETLRVKPRTYVEEDDLDRIKRAPIKESVHVESVQVQPVKQEETKEVKQETKFTSIDLSKETTAQRKAPEKKQVQRSKLEVKQEYEFTPVISPIFGASETEKSHVKKANGATSQTRKTIPATPKKNPLGTILSPIYGVAQPEEMEEEVVEEQAKSEPVMPETQKEPVTMQSAVVEEATEEEDVVALSLDELLQEDKAKAQGDDLLQISLFGDDVVVRTEQQDDSYTIKE